MFFKDFDRGKRRRIRDHYAGCGIALPVESFLRVQLMPSTLSTTFKMAWRLSAKNMHQFGSAEGTEKLGQDVDHQ